MTDPNRKRAIALRNILILAAVAAAAQVGCTTTPVRSGRPVTVANIDRIALLVPENAIVNWDDKPGLDGIVAQVMHFKDYGKGPKSVLVSGEVDIMVFEGPKPDRFDNAGKPFFSQTFTSGQLAQRIVGQYNALWSYSLRVRWPAVPQSSKVWLIARYRPPSGNAVYSSPAEQRMPSKVSKRD
ncbi:MAG: hypothetical protein QGG42_21585 [Phycisphaerae bacterium]|nr:hypothetical protein [Phycisphaerae bacterium]